MRGAGGLFQPKLLAGRRVLVTAGPTFEAIDPVRGITNLSSGKMGFAIARAAAAFRGLPDVLEPAGEIAGVPSLREGKVTRVTEWLAKQGLDWPQVHATFYSDSTNDLPLLEKVQVPVVTNPSPPLRQIAQQRSWRILDLFETS